MEAFRRRVGVPARDSLPFEGLRDDKRGCGEGEGDGPRRTLDFKEAAGFDRWEELAAGDVERDSCLSDCDRSAPSLSFMVFIDWRRVGRDVSNGAAIGCHRAA